MSLHGTGHRWDPVGTGVKILCFDGKIMVHSLRSLRKYPQGLVRWIRIYLISTEVGLVN